MGTKPRTPHHRPSGGKRQHSTVSLKGRKRSRRQPDCLNGNTGGGCEGRGGAHTSRRLDAGLKPSDLPGAVQQATARQGLALTHTSVCVYVCVGGGGGGEAAEWEYRVRL